jgi:hypothetical protein
MKYSNNFRVTTREEKNPHGWSCDVCEKKIYPPIIEYVIENRYSNSFHKLAWVCSEECVNMWILSRI